MEIETADVAIVGGGAAGLAAAIFAAQTAINPVAPQRIVVLDGAKTLGAKILVSGGGRCNVTHHQVRPADFNGSQNIVRNILAAFDEQATVEWFRSLGVELKRESTGKLFPIANSARAVLSALLQRCESLDVRMQTASKVTEIVAPQAVLPHAAATKAIDEPFEIRHERGRLHAARVILCTGGRSLPRSGSDGSGWDIVRTLGHTVTPTFAALVPLVLAPQMFHAQLAGIAQEVELSIFADGKRIDHRTGSLLWTHFGISGPVVMDASRHWTIASESRRSRVLEMKCNLVPGESFESVEKWLIDCAANRPRMSVSNHLTESRARLPARLVGALLRHVSIDPTTPAGQLPRDARRSLVHALTALPLPVTQHRGWNYAEVTAGGVPLNEIEYRTMQSRKMPRLYLAGEILDCDGRIGGFNFQWAWSTGYLAGTAAACAD